MSVTFTQLKQTIDLAEKVKVDSGEKIVKTDKVGRKKNIEVTVTTKGGKYFVYFDKEKYAGSYRSEKDTDKIINDYLKLVGEELQENRAKRDAFKAMGRRRGKDSADIDNTATDDDKKAADKNIMMQLRKAVSLRGMKPIEFADGKKVKVDPKVADKLLTIYQGLKPASKMQLQTVLAKSKRDFDNAVKQLKINEYFEEVDLEEGALSDKWRKGARSVKVGKFELVRGNSGVHKILKDRKPFGDLSLDDDAGMWVGNMKGMKGQWVGGEIDDLFKHLKQAHEEIELEEAGLPPHLAKLFDKDGNFKDPKKQKIFNRMMGDGIGKEIAQKMGRIKFRVDADSAKKKIKVYVDSNDEKDAQRALKNHPAYISGAMRVIPEEVELDEMREPYAVIDTADGNKVVGTASDEKGAKSIISTAQLPPMKIKDKKTLKIVKTRKKQMIGQPIKEEVELDEAMKTWEVKVTKGVNKLKKGTVVKVKARNVPEAMRKAGKEFGDPIAVKMSGYFDAKPVKEELEEKYTAKQYKMAFGVLNDPRWKGGNMTRIVNTIEKIAKGLSKDKAVAKAIQLTNESLEERELTTAEKDKMKKLEKEVPMKDFTDRYGEEKGKAVFYATITKMAKNED